MSAAAILTILKNGETLKSQVIEGEAVLGRAEGCVIRLEDRAISRQHALFRTTPKGVQVEKKSEFAPLSVNGAECTRALLKEGDVISIGPYLMKLTLVKEEPEPAPAMMESKPAEKAPAEIEMTSEPKPEPESEPVSAFEELPSLESPAHTREVQMTPDQGPELNLDSPSSENPGDMHAGNAPLELAPFEMPEVATSTPQIPEALDEPIDEEGQTKVSTSQKLDVRLVLSAGLANITEYKIEKDEVSLGRGKNCDIILNDRKSSRKHCVIQRSGVRFILKDLDSANGTFVNGQKINKEQEIYGEDQLRVGEVDFVFKAVSGEYMAQKDDLSVPSINDIPDVMEDPNAPASFGGTQPGLRIGQDILSSPGTPTQHSPMQPMGIPSLNSGHENLNIPGLTGTNSGKKTSLVEKFRALPKGRQYLWLIIVIAALYFAFFDEDEVPVKKAGKKTAAVAGPSGAPAPSGPAKTGLKAGPSFEALTAEQKRFVESQHTLAFDYYKNKDYDKALYEIRKIFTLIPDYKDSKEIERYALEGKRKMEALEEEKKKREEEAKLKVKIGELVDEAKIQMDKKAYEKARAIFPQILSLDPDNAQVTQWSKELQEHDELIKRQQQEKQVQREINARAWEIYKEGLRLQKKERYYPAIAEFAKVRDIGASDRRAVAQAAVKIRECRQAIADKRAPILAEAKTAEDSGDFAKAFPLYKKATLVDPHHRAGYAGMDRIRSILHDRAKIIYTEAILAESYSDFSIAQKKFKECLDMAPEDDIYHERAQRKLARYYHKEDTQP